MQTDTPETDESWASWPYAGPGMSVHVGRKLERERNAALADKVRLDWLMENHVANFECVENIAGNLERYHIPATREAIDEEISRMNVPAMAPATLEPEHTEDVMAG